FLARQIIQDVEEVLRPADGKNRHNHIASPLEGDFDRLYQLVDALPGAFMQAVAVRRFHYHVVRGRRKLRVRNNRVPFVADVTGEDDLLLYGAVLVPKGKRA